MMTARNIKLVLQYDGTNYSGWQIQPGRPTIQGLILQFLARLEGRPVVLHGAGRTDAGVHALNQVANFFTEKSIGCRQLLRAINANLPHDIRVISVEEVDADFHARYSARQKTYRYQMALGEVVSPFEYRYLYHYPYSLHIDSMRLAGQALTGTHDFAAFATASDMESTTRTISDLSLEQSGDRLIFQVTGNGFLRYMVRTIVGTLIEVGRGKMAAESMGDILLGRDRSSAGQTAPAHGLTLVSVDY
jgi:tRNA pseudouridine38-40 synthase